MAEWMSCLFTWGWGKDGQLGLGDPKGLNKCNPTRIEQGVPSNVCAVSCGGEHSAALTADGALYTWGGGRCGQLGLGDWTGHRSPQRVASLKGHFVRLVVCGSFSTAAVTDAYELFTWGCGREGQLGHGDRSSPKAPRLVEALRDTPIVSVSFGEHHTAALTRDGELLAWGCAGGGRLGLGEDGGEDELLPRQVEALEGIPLSGVACGESFTVAISREEGRVYSWGHGEHGELGQEAETTVSQPCSIPSSRFQHEIPCQLSCGRQHTLLLTEAGNVYTWGRGLNGQLGHGSRGDQRCGPTS